MDLKEVPLFEFEVCVEFWQGAFWLVEYVVWWDGRKDIVEIVYIGEGLDGYQK